MFPNGGQGFGDLFVLWPPLLAVFNASAGDFLVGIVLVGSLSVFKFVNGFHDFVVEGMLEDVVHSFLFFRSSWQGDCRECASKSRNMFRTTVDEDR